MAKLVDALGLGSNEKIHAGSSPVLRKIILICSFIFSFAFLKITMYYARSIKRFPFATSQKNPRQTWNSLLKLSLSKSNMSKKKSRFFSMEYGRPLSKRVLWQMVIPVNMHFLRKPYSFSLKSDFNEKAIISLHQFTQNAFSMFQANWALFRSVLFGKMWLLKNPSLVPGVVWPTQQKKHLVTKMRAFQALTHLLGKKNHTFVVHNLQKLWNLSNPTKPGVWSLASGIDSLQIHGILKSGFVTTIPMASHWLKSGFVRVNESLLHKSNGFCYAGDFLRFWNPHEFLQTRNLLGELFLAGPLKSNLTGSKIILAKTQIPKVSIHSAKSFLWFNNFFTKYSKFQKKPSLWNQSKKTYSQKSTARYSLWYLIL